ncbi:MAG: hypothetical protein AB1352_03980 [Patescibacteria group bacterium]
MGDHEQKKYAGAERKHIVLMSVLLMVIAGAPYLYGYLYAPPGALYTGLHALTPGDFNVYYAQMLQAARGDMAVQNLFAGIDGVGSTSMINGFWYVVGVGAHSMNLSHPLMFHLARIAFIPFLVAVMYMLMRVLVPLRARVVTAALMFFGSGLGYVALAWLQNPPQVGRYDWPLDLWAPESNTFLTLYHSPHLLASLILFLFVLLAFVRAVASPKPFAWQVSSGVAAAALFHFHPFHAVTLGAVLAAWVTILRRGSLRRSLTTLAIIGGIAAPSLLWQFMRLQSDWITREWALQNITPTPALWAVIVGFGLLTPLAIGGIVRYAHMQGRGDEAHALHPHALKLLVSWLVIQGALAVSPLPFQRRVLEGFQVPLTMCAGVGVVALFSAAWWRLFSSLAKSVAQVIIGILLTFSTIGTISRDVSLFYSHYPLFYLSEAQQRVFDFLMRDSVQGIVLSPLDQASFIPAWAGRAVFGGSGAHTPEEAARRAAANWFFTRQGTRDERVQFLRRENITEVVLISSDDREILSLAADPLLQPVLVDHGIGLFTVRE